jgi:hypothetical protein
MPLEDFFEKTCKKIQEMLASTARLKRLPRLIYANTTRGSNAEEQYVYC